MSFVRRCAILGATLTSLLTACATVTTTDDLSSDTEASSSTTTTPASSEPADSGLNASTTSGHPTTADEVAAAPTSSTTPPQPTAPPLTSPDWLGQRPLETNQRGFADAQPTPPELVDRRLPTIDTLPAPLNDTFFSSIGPLEGEPLERSTWKPECPVNPEQLSYVTVSFWGFDGLPHTGELIVAADQAEAIVGVFEKLHDERFPMEEMRIVRPSDLSGLPTGDTNNTATFACRAVTGGSRFSEHAYGLAIDINPFHNPYERNGVVLPELATSYLDRDQTLEGMILRDDLVVAAFAEIGWEWGGNWQSLKDFQHFALNNR